MNQKEFIVKIQELLQMGQEKNRTLSRDEVERFLETMALQEEQKMSVYKYLLENGIHVKNAGETEEVKREAEEQDFVASYKESLGKTKPENFDPDTAEDEDLISFYLPVACALAEEHPVPDMLYEDCVQEATLFLCEAVKKRPEKDVDAFIRTTILEGLSRVTEDIRETKARDNLMIRRVEEVDRAIKTLAGDEERKVSVTEIAVYLDKTEEEVLEVLKLTGDTEEIQAADPTELLSVVDGEKA